MGLFWGGEGFRPLFGGGERGPHLLNTVWPGPRPTFMPSFILIRTTVWPRIKMVLWPEYTNYGQDRTGRQTDRQTDRQRTDSIGRTVLQSRPIKQ